MPRRKPARAECACCPACDIGAYNPCRHLCKFRYAIAEPVKALARSRRHDPKSPFLIGDDRHGGEGTAEFACAAIRIHCEG